MKPERKIPIRIYNYQVFSNITLDMFIADNLLYSNPNTQ